MDDLQNQMSQRPVILSMLGRIVDYAGLFPPASLSLETVLDRYSDYTRDALAWMLGRLVLPRDLCQAVDDQLRQSGLFSDGYPCELNIVLGSADSDAASWVSQNLQAFWCCRAGAVEARWSDESSLEQFASKLPAAVAAYIEVPLDDSLDDRITLLAEHSLFAKVRTGGVAVEAIPSPSRVVEFLAACARHRVPCKATAGLHHPVCGVYPLTYQPDSPCAPMFGFLNLIAAAATLHAEPDSIDEAATWLAATDGHAMSMTDEHWVWNDASWSKQQLLELRTSFLHSFGSCSFTEPIDGLVEMGMMER